MKTYNEILKFEPSNFIDVILENLQKYNSGKITFRQYKQVVDRMFNLFANDPEHEDLCIEAQHSSPEGIQQLLNCLQTKYKNIPEYNALCKTIGYGFGQPRVFKCANCDVYVGKNCEYKTVEQYFACILVSSAYELLKAREQKKAGLWEQESGFKAFVSDIKYAAIWSIPTEERLELYHGEVDDVFLNNLENEVTKVQFKDAVKTKTGMARLEKAKEMSLDALKNLYADVLPIFPKYGKNKK